MCIGYRAVTRKAFKRVRADTHMIREELKNTLLLASALIAIATILFVVQGNYEFLFYVAVLVVLGAVIVASDKHNEYPQWLIWLLFGWGALHMAGGAVRIGDHVLYSQMLVPLIGEPYHILKYDQAVHAYGFFVATVTMHYVLRGHLKKSAGAVAIGLTLFAAGLGLSAVNEIIEFAATVILPSTNVGGYVNTGLDLVFNAIGAGLAVWWLRTTDRL